MVRVASGCKSVWRSRVLGGSAVAPAAGLSAAVPGTVVLVVLSTVLIGAGGCFSTPEGFNSPDPIRRLDAIVEADRTRDQGAIPELIAQLESPDPAARLLAFRALQRFSGGEAFGYRHTDGPLKREAAVNRWVAWAQARAAGPDREHDPL